MDGAGGLFLSYSDCAIAEALARGLSAAGIPIWCDMFPDALPAGDTWVERLEQALEQSADYLVLAGPRPVEGWVRVELDYALHLRVERLHAGRQFALVPLRHGGAVPGKLAGFLGSFQAVTLSSEGALPLVAHVLEALWNARKRGTNLLSFQAYDALGGLSGALTKSADGVVNALGKEGKKEKARRLLMKLVKPGRSTADERQPVPRAETLAAGGGAEADQILARLSGGRDPDKPDGAASAVRLVVVSGEGPGSRVDVVHEALLRQWETLHKWIDESRKALERRDDLEAAAQSWEAAGWPGDGLPGEEQLAHPRGAEAYGERVCTFLEAAVAQERRRVRRARLAVGELVAGLLLVSGVGGFAWIQRSEAERQRVLAESRLKDAIEVADQVVFTIDRELKPIPGTSDVGVAHRQVAWQGRVHWVRFTQLLKLQLGEVAQASGDLAVARGHYEKGLALSERGPAERGVATRSRCQSRKAHGAGGLEQRLGGIPQASRRGAPNHSRARTGKAEWRAMHSLPR